MSGDIVLQEGNAWVFVMEKMSRYLAENLTMIRHTSVITEITSDFSDLPEPETEEVSGRTVRETFQDKGSSLY